MTTKNFNLFNLSKTLTGLDPLISLQFSERAFPRQKKAYCVRLLPLFVYNAQFSLRTVEIFTVQVRTDRQCNRNIDRADSLTDRLY